MWIVIAILAVMLVQSRRNPPASPRAVRTWDRLADSDRGLDNNQTTVYQAIGGHCGATRAYDSLDTCGSFRALR